MTSVLTCDLTYANVINLSLYPMKNILGFNVKALEAPS